ncbi:hypothetical protein [Loktanella sp. S4079]|uniref:hypothetical protein n=1 Tax=Loktanella sp. S4079 TaxID=579483 RepID=UPI0005F9DE06|nr:hypothetical protein [Loktanella sp. S4079]KJZ17919.1 hypothetical protein TW80_16415 [Loktanella sp. S4079]
MADFEIDFEARLNALEARFVRTNRIGFGGIRDALADTNGCTNCDTNTCTNCVANELMNVLLPGEDRPLTGREIVKMLAVAREK